MNKVDKKSLGVLNSQSVSVSWLNCSLNNLSRKFKQKYHKTELSWAVQCQKLDHKLDRQWYETVSIQETVETTNMESLKAMKALWRHKVSTMENTALNHSSQTQTTESGSTTCSIPLGSSKIKDNGKKQKLKKSLKSGAAALVFKNWGHSLLAPGRTMQGTQVNRFTSIDTIPCLKARNSLLVSQSHQELLIMKNFCHSRKVSTREEKVKEKGTKLG
jgi:hypothetical protein